MVYVCTGLLGEEGRVRTSLVTRPLTEYLLPVASYTMVISQTKICQPNGQAERPSGQAVIVYCKYHKPVSFINFRIISMYFTLNSLLTIFIWFYLCQCKLGTFQ